MVRIEDSLQRQAVPTSGSAVFPATTPDPLRLSSPGVQFPYIPNRGYKLQDSGALSIVKAMGPLAAVMEKRKKKEDEIAYLEGKMAQAQGRTEEELRAEGVPRATIAGYLDLQAATELEKGFTQLLSDIDKNDKVLSPEMYKNVLASKVSALYTGDERIDLRMTKAIQPKLQALVAEQVKAHNIYNTTQISNQYTSLLVNTSDKKVLQNMLNTPPSGLSQEEAEAAITNAAVLTLQSGDTSLISLLTPEFATASKAANTATAPVGSIAAKYESSGDVAAIGRGSTDGRAFGTFQISEAPGTMDEFIAFIETKNPDIAARLKSKDTRESEWIALAGPNGSPDELKSLEREFIQTKLYAPAASKLAPDVKKLMGNPAVKEMLFSTAIGHGPAGAAGIFNKVYTAGMGVEEFITAVYEERATRYPSSTPTERSNKQASLSNEMRDVLAVSGQGVSFAPPEQVVNTIGRGLSPATQTKLQAAYKAAWTAGAKRIDADLTNTRNQLITSVTVGRMTVEQAKDLWENYESVIKEDPDWQFNGEAVLEKHNSTLDKVLFSAGKKQQAEAIKLQELEEAISNNTIPSLSSPKQQAAFDILLQRVYDQSVEETKKLPNATDDTFMSTYNAHLNTLMTRHPSLVIKSVQQGWLSQALNPYDADGKISRAAKVALDQYTALASVNKALAHKYLPDTESRAMFKLASDMYASHHDADKAWTMAWQMRQDGAKLADATPIITSNEFQTEMAAAVQDSVNSITPWALTQWLGMADSEVSAEQKDSAVTDMDFLQHVEMNARALVMQYGTSIPKKQLAEMAVENTMHNSTFVMGRLIKNPPGRSLKDDMGLGEIEVRNENGSTSILPAFSDALAAHDAVTAYLQENGAAEFNIPSFKDDVENISVRYNYRTKTFMVSALVDTRSWYDFVSDDPLPTDPVFIPADAIGSWYRRYLQLKPSGMELLGAVPDFSPVGSYNLVR